MIFVPQKVVFVLDYAFGNYRFSAWESDSQPGLKESHKMLKHVLICLKNP